MYKGVLNSRSRRIEELHCHNGWDQGRVSKRAATIAPHFILGRCSSKFGNCCVQWKRMSRIPFCSATQYKMTGNEFQENLVSDSSRTSINTTTSRDIMATDYQA